MAKKKEFNKYEIIGNYTNLYLERKDGNIILCAIDTEDLERLKNTGLHIYAGLMPDTQTYYSMATEYLGKTNGKVVSKTHYLHHIILNIASKILVDHIDNNPLNNRKKNLRTTITKNNLRNRDSKNSNNTSGYRNVTMMGNHWRVQLQVNGKNKLFSDKFTDVRAAGDFAKEMRETYYGEFSGKN